MSAVTYTLMSKIQTLLFNDKNEVMWFKTNTCHHCKNYCISCNKHNLKIKIVACLCHKNGRIEKFAYLKVASK